jgi:hypothetical protein
MHVLTKKTKMKLFCRESDNRNMNTVLNKYSSEPAPPPEEEEAAPDVMPVQEEEKQEEEMETLVEEATDTVDTISLSTREQTQPLTSKDKVVKQTIQKCLHVYVLLCCLILQLTVLHFLVCCSTFTRMVKT